MKQRIISAVFIALITIVACLLGGYFLMAVCAFVCIQGSRETINLRKDAKYSYPLLITMIVSTLLLTFGPYFTEKNIQMVVVILEPIVLTSLAVLMKK